MNLTRLKAGLDRKALAFLSLFVFSVLLIKPIHIFFHSHHAEVTNQLHSAHDKNCEICTFQFSTFASTPNIHIGPALHLHIVDIEINPIFSDIEGLKYVLSLRAPPTL